MVITPSCGYAIRSHTGAHDHHERVHYQSEWFVLIKHFPAQGVEALVLYSMKDEFCRELPPIPPLERGIPQRPEIVAFDGGRVYVLGGFMEQSALTDRGRHVYVLVLNLAEEMQWKKCASMQNSRFYFACGAIIKKIYAFGGTSGNPVFESEVYDPKEDTWSSIKSMPTLRSLHQVVRVEAELVVYGGTVYYPNGESVQEKIRVHSESRFQGTLSLTHLRGRRALESNADTSEVYCPLEDEWRAGPSLDWKVPWSVFFIAQGDLCVMTPLFIYFLDLAEHSKFLMHMYSFPDLPSHGPDFNNPRSLPLTVQAVGDELLAIVTWRMHGNMESVLVRSTGFREQDLGYPSTIVWRKVQASLSFPAPIAFPVSLTSLAKFRLSINPIRLSIPTHQISPGSFCRPTPNNLGRT